MHDAIARTVLAATGASAITDKTVLQALWSGYGEILRLTLADGAYPSVILKHIKLPTLTNHPRGWNTGLSHRRKIRSYQVEARFYRDYARHCQAACVVPDCLALHPGKTHTNRLIPHVYPSEKRDLGTPKQKSRTRSKNLFPSILN